jgi:hypothetical protein
MSAKTSVSGILVAERRDFYLNPRKTTELWPSEIPLTTFSKKLASKRTKDPDFKMFEHRGKWEDMKWQSKTTVTALPAVGASSTVVYDATKLNGIVPYVGLQCDVWSDSSGPTTYKGQIVITAVNTTTTTLTFSLVHKSGTPSFAVGDWFLVVGHASEEGTGAPEAWADDLSVIYNSTQIFKTSVEVTGTLYDLALRGYSKEFARLQAEKRKEHALKMEKAFLFGRRIGGTSAGPAHMLGPNGMPIRTTDGAYSIISNASQVKTVDVTTTPADAFKNLVSASRDVFQYSNSKGIKYAFVGDGFLEKLSGAVDDKTTYNIKAGENRFGFDIRTVETPTGIYKLVRSPLMTRTSGGLYANKAIIIDPENVKHVTYRAPKYQTSIHANDYDGQKDQYMNDEGIALTMPETHWIMELT